MSEDTPESDVETIEAETLKERIDAGEDVTILDVRAEDEFDEWHIEGDSVEIVNVPYYGLVDGLEEEDLERIPEGDPLVVLCAKGGSSELITEMLVEEGRDAVSLAEGMNGWATIYEYEEVETDGDALVAQYQRPSSGCLGYLVVSGDEAAVIDPLRAFTDTYLEDAEEF